MFRQVLSKRYSNFVKNSLISHCDGNADVDQAETVPTLVEQVKNMVCDKLLVNKISNIELYSTIG